MEDIFKQIQDDNLDYMKEYYQSGIFDMCKINENSDSFLHLAIKEDSYFIAKFLLSNDLTYNFKNNDGFTPLELMLSGNNIELCLLFAKKHSFRYMSSFLNSKIISPEMKEYLSRLSENNCLTIDKNNNINIDQYPYSPLVSEYMLNSVKDIIILEKWDSLKDIIVNVYREQDEKINKIFIPFCYIYLSIKNNEDMLNYMLNIFGEKINKIKESDFSKEILKDLFLYANNEAIMKTFSLFGLYADFNNNLSMLSRGSYALLEQWDKKYTINIDKEMFKSIFIKNPEKKYIQFIKKKSNFNNYEIMNFLVEMIELNQKDINEKVMDFLYENKEYCYCTNIENENILHRIIKFNNIEMIDFLINNFNFMLNAYNSKSKYVIFESLKNSTFEIFKLIIENYSVDINVFDESVNNILHFYIYNYYEIIDREIKFKEILIPLISEKILLLCNKQGDTALSLLAKKGKLDEIRLLVNAKKINENIANYSIKNNSLLDLINIEGFKQVSKSFENSKLTLSVMEDSVLHNDIVGLSKLLYLYEIEKDKRKDIKNDLIVLSLINKSKDLNLIKLFCAYYFSIDGINDYEIETPIFKAIKNKDVDQAIFLIHNKCEINTIINNESCLSIAVENELDVIVYLLLNEKIEVDLSVLSNTKYDQWRNLRNFKSEKIITFPYKKEKYKERFFDKNELYQYKIEKNDSNDIKKKKIILNTIDRALSLKEVIDNLHSELIDVELFFVKNSLAKIYFRNEEIGEVSNFELGMGIEEAKSKIKYNYFDYKKIKESD